MGQWPLNERDHDREYEICMDMNIKRMGLRPFDTPDIFELGPRPLDMFELDERSF